MIARALGDFVHDPAAGAALAEVVERGDASYFVEAEAALALGKTRTPRAGELLRLAATRDSYIDVIRQHAYRGLAEARDDSALGLLVEGLRWGRVSQGRRAAAMALAQLMRGRRDREARDVRERIELLLTDRDFRVQAAALEALAQIGDPAAIAALRRMIDRELDGRLRRRGKEVIRDLEDGASTGEDVRRMRDELGEVRALAATLRERIEKLEAGRGESPPAAGKSRGKDGDQDKVPRKAGKPDKPGKPGKRDKPGKKHKR
jgi:aminopeptidase N